jgi:uncharacterized membrane protein HdeD (DUF308 family)
MYSGGMFILKGILGILFGILLILAPKFALGTFLTMFGLLIIAAGAIAFLFAVTSKQTDTMFWFMVSGGIVILGILAIFAHDIFAAFFALIIAGWALITGLLDLEKFVCSQRRFYAIMAVLSGISLAFIAVAFYAIPSFHGDYLSRIFGVYAVVFGIFSLILGQRIISGKIPKCLGPVSPVK